MDCFDFSKWVGVFEELGKKGKDVVVKQKAEDSMSGTLEEARAALGRLENEMKKRQEMCEELAKSSREAKASLGGCFLSIGSSLVEDSEDLRVPENIRELAVKVIARAKTEVRTKIPQLSDEDMRWCMDGLEGHLGKVLNDVGEWEELVKRLEEGISLWERVKDEERDGNDHRKLKKIVRDSKRELKRARNKLEGLRINLDSDSDSDADDTAEEAIREA